MIRIFHRLNVVILFLIAFSFSPGAARGQVTTGTPSFGSFSGGPETINNANLNVHLDIPIIHKPGRGTAFTYDLTYDSSIWYPVGVSGSQTWQPVSNWGWASQTEAAIGQVNYTSMSTVRCRLNPGELPPQYGTVYIYHSWYYVDEFGTFHPSGLSTQDSDCGDISSGSAVVTDGSGYTIYATGYPSGYAVSRYGKTINTSNAPGFTDRNGNEITVSGGVVTDTLGTTALTVSGTAPNPIYFTYTPPSGTAVSYKMVYSTYSIQTNFGCTGSGISEYGINGTTTANLVSEIDLPDDNPNGIRDRYTFAYEATPGHTGYVTGRLASVTLPTGGRISYAYSGGGTGVNGITCADGSAATLTRTTPDGTWTYAQVKGSGAASTTTITDPQGNNTVVQFQGIYETQRDTYQGAVSPSNLMQTIQTCYNGNTTNCTSTVVGEPISRRNITTILPGGLQSEHDELWNSYGVQTEVDDYDYGAAPHGSLLKKTLITYAGLGNNINAFQQTVTICNGTGSSTACTGPSGNSTGTVVAQTNYNYDETAVTGTSSPQHTSVSGSRGNLTSINYYVNGTTYLTKRMTYFDTGNVYTSTDVNGAQTTFTYGACGNAFPTSVAEPLSMTRSMTWDTNCYGGVMTSLTDENNQTTSFTYNDSYFWRPSSTTDPANYVTNLTYTGQKSIESNLSFNSGSSATDVLTTLDGLGRSQLKQTRQSPSSQYFDSVEQDYDSLGRATRSTLPYTGTSGQTNSTAPAVTTTYDPLGRVSSVTEAGGGTVNYTYNQNDVLVKIGPAPNGENTKQRQLEYNALGQLTSVCEITSGSGSGTCGQTNSQTGYWTKYVYDALGNLTGVTQNAQSSSTQTRSYSYDFLSRLTSDTNPESGTTTYIFDTDSTCGTSDGDAVKKVDAIGNVTCTAYDALHRPTSITYPSGSYASVTPNKYFTYGPASGSVTVDGVAMANAKDRLAEAYTCVSPCSSKKTDEGFSYTDRGEISDVYEWTTNSGGWYHVTQSYWANGAPDVLTQNLGNLPGMTYGPDGEGRTNSVSAAGTGQQKPVTSTAYPQLYPTNSPMQVNFGSGDSDVFTFDTNTGRMTQFKFNVGTQSKSLTGALTWNDNGTLQELAVTDQFNAANTQTCKYGDPSASPPVPGYDDLGRLVSANCGTAAGQTFSYDAFGNSDKSGSPFAFQPTYSFSTNQMTSVSGCTPTYDSNGNATNDCNNTYTWDADGNSITVGSVGLTFDAFDRMVEQNRSGSYTQIVYSPTGAKLALMNGQSLVKAFIPLPGQATAVYTSSGLDHYQHSDWLGSVRLTSSPSQTYTGSIAYAPFGETYASYGSPDTSFTGMNPDTVSTDYDFLMREYSIEGRWPSPDPAGLAAVNPANPQSWNRYAYVLNNPTTLIDPLGLLCGGTWFSDVIDAECSVGMPYGPGFGGGSWGLQCSPVLTEDGDSCHWAWNRDQGNGPQRLGPGAGGGPGGGPGGGQAPKPTPQPPKLRPPTQQEYNACIAAAQTERDNRIANDRVEQIGAGLLTLGGTYIIGASISAGLLTKEIQWELLFHGHGVGSIGNLGIFGPAGIGAAYFYIASADIGKAWNDFHQAEIHCAAAIPTN